MAITVYWTCLEKEWFRASEPINISKRFYDLHRDDHIELGTVIKCPATTAELNNLYGLQSLYDYKINVDSQKLVSSPMYDQQFFDEHVLVRDKEKKIYIFSQRHIFFTEEDSLEVTMQIPPYFENTAIAKDVFSIPGTLDIGKWFRATEHTFYMKDGINSIQINEKDILFYMKFHTKQKIIFKEFMSTDKILKYAHDITASVDGRALKGRKLDHYYKMFKPNYKKFLIEEIKKNLLE